MNQPTLLPAGIVVSPLTGREYAYQAPGMAQPVRVTTDSEFYEEHAESVELWSPGNPLFPEPEVIATDEELPLGESLRELLARIG